MRTSPSTLSESITGGVGRAWQLTPLGDVLDERKETPDPVAIEFGEIPIIAKIGFNSGQIELRSETKTNTKMILIHPGDLVVSGINAAKGAIAIYPEDAASAAAATIHYAAYEVKADRADKSFLWWLLRSNLFRNILTAHLPGGIKMELKAKRLLPVSIPLPRLEEQQRIVAKFEHLAAKIDDARGLRATSSREPDALFLASIDSCLGDLCQDSPKRSLITLVDPDRGISYGIVQTGNPYIDGVPTLRAGDLQQFKVNTESVKFVDPDIEAKYQRTRLGGGEVLLRIRGGLGETAVCPQILVGGNVSREIAVIPVTAELNPWYVMYAIAAPSSQDFLHGHVRGTSYLGINLKDVRRLTIPVPSIEEQCRIVSYLDGLKAKLERLKLLQQKTAAELDALLSSILDKAFKGDL